MQILIEQVWAGAWHSAFLTSSQVESMLLFGRLHFWVPKLHPTIAEDPEEEKPLNTSQEQRCIPPKLFYCFILFFNLADTAKELIS